MSDPRLRIISATTEGIVFELCETEEATMTADLAPAKRAKKEQPAIRVSITVDGNRFEDPAGNGLYLTRGADSAPENVEATIHALAYRVGRMVRELHR